MASVDEIGSPSYCWSCGTALEADSARCTTCGRVGRMPSRSWLIAAGVAAVLQSGWSALHGRSAFETLGTGLLMASLIAAVALILDRRTVALSRPGGVGRLAGITICVLVTAVICLPIFTNMGRDEDFSTPVLFAMSLVMMPLLIGVPAGFLIAGGAAPVSGRLCRRCSTASPPMATYCMACGEQLPEA